MKRIITFLIIASALVLSARAEETAKISNVHLCCDKCVKGVDKAVSGVSNAKATCDKEAGTVELTGPDKETVQKAADALLAAGYFGSSSDVKLDASSGAKDEKVQKMTVNGVHLCCAKCVKAVDKALKTVPGVSGNTATKGADSFDVTGDFNALEVMNALQKAGLTGKAQ